MSTPIKGVINGQEIPLTLAILSTDQGALDPSTSEKQDEQSLLLTEISGKLGTGLATEANQSTEITALNNILAKLIAAPSTAANQTTIINSLASILAKIIATPATEAKQDTQITTLNSILSKIIASPATETTLNSILSKIIAAPATEATLSSLLTATGLINSLGVYIKDGANLDAFGRTRISDPMTLFSVQQQYDSSPIQLEAGSTGNGVTPAHNANSRMSALVVNAGTGTSWMQSYQYIPYQPGKSQLIKMTGVLGTAIANTTVEFGYMDDDNGVFLRQNGTSGLQFVLRSKTSGSIVETVVNKASWNLNPNITINESNNIILVIDLQFLGMGRLRCGFNRDGKTIYCHEFLNENNISVPYMQTASLPVRIEVKATVSAATKTSWLKCVSVESEGGFIEDYGYSFSTPILTDTAANGVFTPIMSLRPKLTYNGFTNRSQLILVDFNLAVTGNNGVDYIVTTGTTYSTATYTDVDASSAFEYASVLPATATTIGRRLHSGFVSATNGTKDNVEQALSLRTPIALNRAGQQTANGTINILCSGTGANTAVRVVLNYKEIR